jgi:NADPH:quinone reductase-like Zn-dependent oxidoreductase
VYADSRADFLRMTGFLVKRRLHPVIERTYTLENYESALKDLASGNFIGKLVIAM